MQISAVNDLESNRPAGPSVYPTIRPKPRSTPPRSPSPPPARPISQKAIGRDRLAQETRMALIFGRLNFWRDAFESTKLIRIGGERSVEEAWRSPVLQPARESIIGAQAGQRSRGSLAGRHSDYVGPGPTRISCGYTVVRRMSRIARWSLIRPVRRSIRSARLSEITCAPRRRKYCEP
jgi:hypothetical protein